MSDRQGKSLPQEMEQLRWELVFSQIVWLCNCHLCSGWYINNWSYYTLTAQATGYVRGQSIMCEKSRLYKKLKYSLLNKDKCKKSNSVSAENAYVYEHIFDPPWICVINFYWLLSLVILGFDLENYGFLDHLIYFFSIFPSLCF